VCGQCVGRPGGQCQAGDRQLTWTPGVLRLHAQVYSFPAKLWKILKNVQIVHEKVIDLDVKYLFAIIYIYVFQAFTIFFIY